MLHSLLQKNFVFFSVVEIVLRSVPYHSSSNRSMDRFVQTFTRSLAADEGQNTSLQFWLNTFLMSYHTNSHGLTGATPCELFLKHVKYIQDLTFLKLKCKRLYKTNKVR